MRSLVLSMLVMLAACDRDDATPAAPSATAPANSAAGGDVPAAPERDGDEGGETPATTPEAADDGAAFAPTPSATVRLVDIYPDGASLREQIVAAAAQAKADGKSVAVELWAGWCPPCKKLDTLLRGGPVAAAVANAVLIRVDTDVWNDELTALGYDAPQIPTLYRIDERGKPKGKRLTGAKWSRESETAIAAQLTAFLGS